MSVALTFNPSLSATETLESNAAYLTDAAVTHGLQSLLTALTLGTLNASSSPPVSRITSFNKAMSGGTGSIDFTAMPVAGGQGSPTYDATGLKPRFCVLLNPSTNTGSIVVADGASNGHNFFGDGSGQITLLPGQWIILYFAGNAAAVASGDKTIDLTGTTTEALTVFIVFGS